MKTFLIKIIELYQKYISLDYSIWAKKTNRIPHCKYIPSCSEYMKESIIKKGIFIGLGKGIWRILRCNPWSNGGYDPVDKK